MKICITGYRPNKLPQRYGYNIHSAAYVDLQRVIKDILDMELIRHSESELECISGMALGIDQAYVDFLAEKYRNCIKARGMSLEITAAVPCRGQETKWPIASREEYHRLLALCDNVHYVTNGSFTSSCREERNRWMVDCSDVVIAVWDGKSGGTANCVRYAKQKKRTIYYVDPATLQVRRQA